MGIPAIPPEKLTLCPPEERPAAAGHTAPPRTYLADARRRFAKNRSSVVAAGILLALVLFAILAPMISPNRVRDTDATYRNHPPFIPRVAALGLGLWDGAVTHESQSEAQKLAWEAIGRETGLHPIIRVKGTTERIEMYRGEERRVVEYKLENNKYYERGVVHRTLSYAEYEAIQDYQNRTGEQVLYPYVRPEDIHGIGDNANIWYRVKDQKGTPDPDADGRLVPVYATVDAVADPVSYGSLRIDGDPGNYLYGYAKSGSVHVRVCYYRYYQYQNGRAPIYPLGTNSEGQCLLAAIGVGARVSLLFSLAVSAINLTLGMLYGAVQGYYGGTVDLVMDRLADILSGVPFIVVCTLFRLHLAARVGMVITLLFAFVLTGWLGTAALTRKQFYRYKGQEFVLAARTLGATDRRLMLRHIFPNALGTLITGAVPVIPGVIGLEATMTYLGIINLRDTFGTSLGVLLAQGQTAMTAAPHAMLYPAIFLSLLLISFNLFGNGLRDAFDPATRGEGA